MQALPAEGAAAEGEHARGRRDGSDEAGALRSLYRTALRHVQHQKQHPQQQQQAGSHGTAVRHTPHHTHAPGTRLPPLEESAPSAAPAEPGGLLSLSPDDRDRPPAGDWATPSESTRSEDTAHEDAAKGGDWKLRWRDEERARGVHSSFVGGLKGATVPPQPPPRLPASQRSRARGSEPGTASPRSDAGSVGGSVRTAVRRSTSAGVSSQGSPRRVPIDPWSGKARPEGTSALESWLQE
eukprot:351816-Chlamydomonas_euryale.AAC.1